MDSPPHISPAQRPPRRRAACQFCHQSKLKCSRGQPCLRCQNNQRECHYELSSRIGKPRGSKNGTSSRSPLPRVEGMEAMAKASVDALGNEGEKRSIAPFANMVNFEFSDPVDEQQHQLLLQTRAGSSWTYSPSDLGQSNSMTPSLITSSPSENSTSGSGFDLLSHGNLMDFSTPESFLNSIPSLPDDDTHYSHTSSVSPPETEATSPPQNSRPTFVDSKANWLSPAHSFTTCACLATLSASIIPLSSPYASSVPYTLDAFLSSTSTLLTACNNFLSCLNCPKNSLGLCLVATAFVTFNQLFTSFSQQSHTNSPISDASPAALVLGTYHVPASDSSAVRALMLKLTVQRWRETCVGIRKLMREMSAKAEKGEEDALTGTGEGVDASGQTGLWTGRDIDFFRQLVLRVDRELVVYCRKAGGRE